MPKDARETRERLLDTAERLMAEHGPEGVSMREISVAAGQGNNNAAQYHFESREGIIEAALQRRMAGIDQRRVEMIAALDPDASLSALVGAVVVPLAEASRQHPFYVRFFAQLRLSSSYGHLVAHTRVRTSGFHDVREQIDTLLGHLSAQERVRRRWLCATLIVHSIAEFVAVPEAQPYRRWNGLVDDLVATCRHILDPGDRAAS